MGAHDGFLPGSESWLLEPPVGFESSSPDDVQTEHRTFEIGWIFQWGGRDVLYDIWFARRDEPFSHRLDQIRIMFSGFPRRCRTPTVMLAGR